VISGVIEALNGTWKFLLLMTETAPLGVWTFLIAAIFPAVFLPWLKNAAPKKWAVASRDFILQTVAIFAGVMLAWLPWQTLEGFLVGVMAGFMSPYLHKGGQAVGGLLYRWWHKRLLGREPQAPCPPTGPPPENLP
jgi:hypothetical protein